MFAKTIIDSDAFLEMPLSTQALYFHLAMRADDEGFINAPKRIARTVGCNDDDLKVLACKRFIIPFESGIVVIKHWKIHNYIRGDRIKSTVYQEERTMLTVKENAAYSISAQSELPATDICQSDGRQMADKCPRRLGKVRLDKASINTTSITDDTTLPEPPAPSRDGLKSKFVEFWKAYPKKVGKCAAEKAFFRCKPDDALLARMLMALDTQRHTDQWTKENGQFIPNPATWLNQGRWEDEVKTAAQADVWGGVPEV